MEATAKLYLSKMRRSHLLHSRALPLRRVKFYQLKNLPILTIYSTREREFFGRGEVMKGETPSGWQVLIVQKFLISWHFLTLLAKFNNTICAFRLLDV